MTQFDSAKNADMHDGLIEKIKVIVKKCVVNSKLN